MNKPIDDLFEQARASLKADMPLEKVETLIQRSAKSSSIWTWKTIISSMSIIGIIIAITVGSLFQSSTETPKVEAPQPSIYSMVAPTETSLVDPTSTTLRMVEQTIDPLLVDSLPPTPPTPPIPPTPPTPPNVFSPLGPKKTFTEYTLEIRKDNSEKELQALQKELNRYGINLQIKKLTYNPDQTIKRFKGRFETDSLFCSTQMKEHEFDIQGAFKSMQFTFRVAGEKNLKYLKIQSDDFEQTIECYDDEVLTSSAQAQRSAALAEQAMRQAERQMYRVQKEAEHAQRQMQMAHQQAARSRANILRLKADSIYFISRPEFLDSFPEKEFLIKGDFSITSDKNVDLFFNDLKGQLKSLEKLAEEDFFQMDSILLQHTLRNYSDELLFEIENARLDIEKELQKQLRFQREVEIEIDERMEQHEMEILEKEITVEELEEEAAILEAEAKQLKKTAKRLKKQLKKTAKKSKG
ncbi:MAG: hypothetical protein ACRBFS_05395 [Aureispira sp.]